MLPIGQALKAVDGWDGEFIVDTAVELELTRNEEVVVIQEVKQSLMRDLQIQVMSPAEIRPLIDATKAHIKLVGMDKYFQDSEIDAFYEAIIQKNVMMQQMQQQAEMQKQQEKQRGGEDIFAGRKGATRSTPEEQKQSARMGANAPQPV
jgi:superfamily II DNA helicase RecQ